MDVSQTDPTQPERLPDDAPFEQKLEKFSKIVAAIKPHGINLLRLENGNPVLEYNGSTLTHNSISWYIFKVDEVASMIIHWKENLPSYPTDTSKN
jgi:hypothetical protein